MNDLLGTPDHCLLHHYIHWWFDYSPWLAFDWISAHSFFLWYICSSHGISFALATLFFVHIGLYSVFNIFHTSFLYIPSTIRYSLFLLFHHRYIHLGFFLPHWYIHIGRPQIHGLWDSMHILHFIHKGMRFHNGIIEPSFHSFLHFITLAYVTSWVLRPPKAMTSHIVLDSSYVGDT